MTQVQSLDRTTIAPFLEQPDCLLILSKSDCDACNRWQVELDAWLGTEGNELPMPVGKLNLDQRGLGDFKRNHTWIQDVDSLPFNVIFKGHEIHKKFAGTGIERLLNRLRRLEMLSATDK